jgi:2-polyprenyl-3-methyl-5-hydroxy-6-metoxy-1,4-benzoquinol methylase
MILHPLRRAVPQWVKDVVPQVLKDQVKPRDHSPSLPSYSYLQNLMCCYQTANLANVTPDSFKRTIDEFLSLQDHEMEGFENPDKQRDLSVKFHWGHNHDFGAFALEGRMGNRHLAHLARFIDAFQAIDRSLEGLRVLDIGCWTGGTSLLLCAMGAHVVAIDEIKKYIDCLEYMKQAFDIKKLEPMNLSLYDCSRPDFQDAFDIVLFAGVLYHVTDPILALRTTFNCLKDDGLCLLETAAVHTERPILTYERSNWNWFFPSLTTLAQMMADVGFTDVKVQKALRDRAYAVGKRKTHTDMRRDGLSNRATR